MADRIEGKVAWITGAGTGIGRALALELARRGATLALSGRRADKLEAVAREAESHGVRAVPIACDVTDEREVERAAAAIVSTLGQLDIAIANAGFSVSGTIESLSAEDWRRQLDTNVVGAAMTAKYALPHLRASSGRLGLVASVAAMVSAPRAGAYSASKYALRAMGQALAMELHGSGVSCTLLHPGFVESDIAQVDNAGRVDPSRVDKRPKNLMWPADKAAATMVDALWARKLEHVFTAHGRVGAFLGQHFPGLVHTFMTRGPGGRSAGRIAKSTG